MNIIMESTFDKSTYLKKHCKELQYLCKAKPSIQKAIVEKANKSLIYCICECVQNILKGHVRLTTNQRKRLRRHKTNLRKLLEKKTSLVGKKRIVQKGGFLGALAPILLPLATQVLSKLF